MSQITKKEMREIEVVTGVKCDVCGKEKEVDRFYKDNDNISYVTLSGGWNENINGYLKHFCSLDCMIELIKEAHLGGTISFSMNFVSELNKKEKS